MANDTGLPFLHEPPASGFAPGIGEPIRLPFDNSYARLPERFYARLPPTPVAAPRLIKLNTALAAQLGLDAEALASPAGVAGLGGATSPPRVQPPLFVPSARPICHHSSPMSGRSPPPPCA